ncbi:MAG: hypothetical protein FGM33_07455 [Candidatus Kapabacteria bacterium]|nr:hypothetical protein [Candidatus Kapabacteria bacterium]
MTRMIILSFVQSALSVGGITLLHNVLDGRGQHAMEAISSLLTIRGLAGTVLLFSAFAVMSYMLTFMKATVFIPMNTATTFLLTVLIGLFTSSERPSLRLILGMALVLTGIAVIATQRQ